ncbi:hypothetical protein [Salinimonas marina]|uniref:hypothetical protein n=1 Tax=Salinimonas marina TaxID=2785918 RepID=UPI001E3DDDB4|nr:hypothetical protein [Salinimonas marina]
MTIPCRVLFHDPAAGVVRFCFLRTSEVVRNEIVAFTMGDSRRWQSFQRRRTRPISYLYGVRHVLRVSLRPVFKHFVMQLQALWQQWVITKGK